MKREDKITLTEITDPTWGTGLFYKRLVLVAVKQSGEITEWEKHKLLSEAWERATDNGTFSIAGRDRSGRGLLLVFDTYVVEQLSLFKRLRHSLRVFKAAITGNVSVCSDVRVVILK